MRQVDDRLREAAVAGEHGANHGGNAEQHHDALQEVVHHGGHVAAEHHVNAGDKRHANDACLVRQAERHAEQARQAVVDARGVGDEEHEDDGRGGDAQRAAVVALAEELGHGGGTQALRHLARAGAEHPPGEQAAQNGVADAHPRGRQAVFPTELAGVADEDDGREVRRAERERGKPRAYVTAAKNESGHAAGVFLAQDADDDGDCREGEHHGDFCDHWNSQSVLRVWARTDFSTGHPFALFAPC